MSWWSTTARATPPPPWPSRRAPRCCGCRTTSGSAARCGPASATRCAAATAWSCRSTPTASTTRRPSTSLVDGDRRTRRRRHRRRGPLRRRGGVQGRQGAPGRHARARPHALADHQDQADRCHLGLSRHRPACAAPVRPQLPHRIPRRHDRVPGHRRPVGLRVPAGPGRHAAPLRRNAEPVGLEVDRLPRPGVPGADAGRRTALAAADARGSG